MFKTALEILRLLSRLPKTLESIDQRLKALETPTITVGTPYWTDGTGTFQPNIQVLPYTTPGCPGGCEYPSHYVGDFIPCKKCGRSVPADRTIITCQYDPTVSFLS